MSAIRLRSGCGSMPFALVVLDLLLAAARGLVDRRLHRVGEDVGVHVHLARDVARRAADRLDERGRRAEEPLLVGVEDGDERHLGQVEALAQQVDADEHVVDARPQLGEQFDPAQRVDIRVQVAHAHARLGEEVGELLGHALGEGGDEHPLVALGAQADLLEEVVDLALRGLHDDLRVDEARRTDDLLDHAVGDAHLVAAGRRREVDRLARRGP